MPFRRSANGFKILIACWVIEFMQRLICAYGAECDLYVQGGSLIELKQHFGLWSEGLLVCMNRIVDEFVKGDGLGKSCCEIYFLSLGPSGAVSVAHDRMLIDALQHTGCRFIPIDGESHIEAKPSFFFWECILMMSCSGVGREFACDPVVEFYQVIARAGFFVGVIEGNEDARLRRFGRIREGQHGDIAPVADAGAAQVGMTESGDGVAGIVIAAAPIPSFLAVVGTELHHAEGDGGAGVNVAMSACTQERIDIASQSLGRKEVTDSQ